MTTPFSVSQRVATHLQKLILFTREYRGTPERPLGPSCHQVGWPFRPSSVGVEFRLGSSRAEERSRLSSDAGLLVNRNPQNGDSLYWYRPIRERDDQQRDDSNGSVVDGFRGDEDVVIWCQELCGSEPQQLPAPTEETGTSEDGFEGGHAAADSGIPRRPSHRLERYAEIPPTQLAPGHPQPGAIVQHYSRSPTDNELTGPAPLASCIDFTTPPNRG